MEMTRQRAAEETALDQAEKARVNRLRRAAERQGLVLIKSRRRDPLALDYGWYIHRGQRQLAHFRDLDRVETWLTDPASRKSGAR
jgi:hypothetical protein